MCSLLKQWTGNTPIAFLHESTCKLKAVCTSKHRLVLMIHVMKTTDAELDDQSEVSIFYLSYEWSCIIMTHKRFSYTSLSHIRPRFHLQWAGSIWKSEICFKVKWPEFLKGFSFPLVRLRYYASIADPCWLNSFLQISSLPGNYVH